MKTLNVNYQKEEVRIFIENGLINNLNKYFHDDKKYFIITDENVARLYLNKITNLINSSYSYIIPPAETSKDLKTFERIILKMLECGVTKSDYIVAFGGGVVGDLAGFIASVYKRGIKLINIPTTFLAQVDSCLGGKTGLDIKDFKNQIGSYYHPGMIFIDPLLINTLPKPDIISGIGEIIKYGLCFDEQLFYSLFKDINYKNTIFRCLIIKAKITSNDEFDQNQRLSLNFGHTIGHGIESYLKYQISHGHAVALGMLYEIKDNNIKEKLIDLYHKLDIKIDFDFSLDNIKEYIIQDKKISDGFINIPVLEKIGAVKIQKIKLEDYLRGL